MFHIEKFTQKIKREVQHIMKQSKIALSLKISKCFPIYGKKTHWFLQLQFSQAKYLLTQTHVHPRGGHILYATFSLSIRFHVMT